MSLNFGAGCRNVDSLLIKMQSYFLLINNQIGTLSPAEAHLAPESLVKVGHQVLVAWTNTIYKSLLVGLSFLSLSQKLATLKGQTGQLVEYLLI